MDDVINSTVLKITTEMAENADEFIYRSLGPFCDTVTGFHVEKKQLAAALRRYYRLPSPEANDMDKVTTEMMEHICDNLCQYPKEQMSQEDLDCICDGCKMGRFVCDILNLYERLDNFDKTQSAKMLEQLSGYTRLDTAVEPVRDQCDLCCPNCHTTVGGYPNQYYVSYCPDCGQKILKSEDKENGIVE